jgi:phosphate-selective porin
LLGEDYFYWNAGLSWFVTSYLAIDLRYVDAALSNDHEPEHDPDQFYPRQQDNKYLFSITLGF